jgi:hypothetical protein
MGKTKLSWMVGHMFQEMVGIIGEWDEINNYGAVPYIAALRGLFDLNELVFLGKDVDRSPCPIKRYNISRYTRMHVDWREHIIKVSGYKN